MAVPERKPVIIYEREYPYLDPFTLQPIDGSYFLGLILDYDTAPTLQRLYAQTRTSMRADMADLDKLRVVKDITKAAFPINDYYAVGAFGVKRQRERRDVGEQLTLEDFLVEKKGFCVQHTATSSLIIERLIREGIMLGKVNVGELTVDLVEESEGHVWVEYHSGLSYVVDSAYDFVGTKEEYMPIQDRIAWQITLRG